MPPQNGELVIDDSNFHLHTEGNVVVDGERKSFGMIPRDYTKYPLGCYASAPAYDVNMPLIPRSEWSARIREMEAQKSRISDIRATGKFSGLIPSLDQNGKGYCWMHSGVGATIMLRAVNHMPYVSLSAYAGACIIKGYRDEGGWGAQGLDFLTQRGIPSEEFWPQRSMSSSNDKPATWENAALHKVTEGWVDLQAAQYDRNLTWDQVMTLLLSRVPVVGDFNWWGHSVCLIDPVEVSPGSFGVRILNSWGDSWSDRGMGVLEGSKAIPDSSVAPRATIASAA